MKLKYLYLLTFLCFVQMADAQRTISGVVIDEYSGEILIGANVIIKDTYIGTTADFEGKFSLEAPNDASILIVSYTGYANKEVNISRGISNLKIALQPGTIIDEVVVTSLGLIKKRQSLVYSTQKLDKKEFNVSRVGDLSSQLQGLVPGLTISRNAGSGVSSSRIVLRGESSLNLGANEPLIILDGVPISNNFNGIKGGNSRTNQPIDYGDGLSDINPDDIQDISVLKGPKAAALYGTRAANGALVIRTVNGKYKEGIGITYTTGVSFDKVTRFWDVQNEFSGGWYTGEFEYANFGGWGFPLDGRLQVQPTVDFGQVETPSPTPLTSQFRPKEFFQTAVGTNNHLSLSFNKENKVYGRVSLSYQDKDGIIPNTGYQRKSISTRIGAELTERFTLDLSSNFVNSGSNNVPVMGIGDDSREGLMYALIWAPNNVSIKDYEDNYWFFNNAGIRTQRSVPGWITNPQIIAQENLNSFDRNRFFGNVKGSYEFSDQFTGFVRIGIDRYDDARASRRPSGQSYFANGMYREQNISFQEVNADFLLSYSTQLDDIGLGMKIGGNTMRQKASDFQVRVDQLDILDVYNFGNALDRPKINEADAEKRINSFYGSANLSFDDKLFVDVTGRNDWSSTLSERNNSFFYPSLGVSAIISKMALLSNNINYLQVRASWAKTGNDTDPQLINPAYAYGTLPGSATNQRLIVDPSLKPERTTSYEVGFDLKMFNYKWNIELNLYRNSTEDQILRTPISSASGAGTYLFNAGLVRNQGIEFLVQTTTVRTKNFSWDIALNWSKNKGKVIELASGIESLILAQGPALPGIIIQATPGGQMGDIYGKDYIRHNGQIVWNDVDGLATPSYDTELKKVGNYNPDWISGLSTNLTYKGVTLKVIGEYRHRGVLFTETGARLMQAGKDTETLNRNITPTVTPQGVMPDGNGGFVTNTLTLPYFNFVRRTRHWENAALNTFDATFFKVREVSIGTDLKNYFDGLPFNKLALSIYGRNVFTKTKSHELRHFDPESFMFNQGILVPGVESGQLPTPSTFGFNLSVGF